MAAPKFPPDEASMPIIELVESDADLAAVADRVTHDGSLAVIMRDGAPVAEIVPIREATARELEAAHRREMGQLLDEIAELFADVDPDEHEREVQRAIDETRAELRAESDAAHG